MTLTMDQPQAFALRLRAPGWLAGPMKVEVNGKLQMQVPLHHLGAVVTMGNVMISPFFMGRCADDGRALVILDRNGRFKCRVVGKTSGKTTLLWSVGFLTAAAAAAAGGTFHGFAYYFSAPMHRSLWRGGDCGRWPIHPA